MEGRIVAQVIPFVAKVLATKIIGALTVGAIVKSVAVYAISKALTKKASGVNSGTTLQLTQDADAYRRVIYGSVRASGNIVFAHASGKKNKYLQLVIAVAGHEVNSIGTVYIEDAAATLDSNGYASGDFDGVLRVKKWDGSQTTADADLITETAGRWTSACVLQGIAALYCKLTYDQEAYATGLPNISAIVQGKRVYDPRTETTAFSRNPALCILDYLRNSDFGIGCDDDEIDFASFIAAANICDESVTLASGGSEPRYRLDGVFTTDSEPASVIEAMLATMCGEIVYSSGKFYLYAGAYYEPDPNVATFSEGDIVGPIDFQSAAALSEVCNVVKGTYTSATDLYMPKDYPTVRDESAITDDGGEISRSYPLAWVQSPAQAQRVAKIEMKKSRLGGMLSMSTNLKGAQVRAGDTIKVSNTRFGWSDKTFRVVEWKFGIDERGAMSVDMLCREHDASIYGWTAASDEGDASGGSEQPEIPNTPDSPILEGTTTPGTYDDLNNTPPAVPAGNILVQSRGGGWQIGGWPEYVASTPPRRYLTRSLSGTITRYGYSGTGVCGGDPYSTTNVAHSGVSAWSWATGALERTTYAQITNDSDPPTPSDTAFMPLPDMCDESLTATTRTVVANNVCHDNGNNTSERDTGSATETLGSEDTDDAAIERMMSSPTIMSGGTAIRTQRQTLLTGIYRQLRWGTYIGNTYTPLTGLTPWARYRIRGTIEFRTVDETGDATGEWVEVGETASAPFIASIDGTGGSDWVTIEPSAGGETRVVGLVLEIW